MRRDLLTVSLVGLLLLGACGSSGSDTTAGPTTTSGPPVSAADQRIARAALLKAADAPGYQQVPRQHSLLGDLPPDGDAAQACSDYLASRSPREATGQSLGLQRGTAIADSSLAIYADAAAAQAELELLRAPAMATCLDAVYAPKGTTLAVTPVSVPALGDDRVAYRLRPAAQADAPSGIDIVVVRVGRALVAANIVGTTADADQIVNTAIAKAVDRVRTAGA